MAKRQRTPVIQRLLQCGLAMVIAWLIGLMAFLAFSASLCSPRSSRPVAVVFTGAPERVETSLQLIAKRQVQKLLISGVDPGVDLLMILEKWTPSTPRDGSPLSSLLCVELGPRALDTIGNAIEASEWLQRQPALTSCSLIDSDYHLARSLWELRRRLPSTWRVEPFCVSSAGKPWSLRAGLFLREYHKWIAAWILGTLQLEPWTGPHLSENAVSSTPS